MTELRPEDPHGFRDYGQALEQAGQLTKALDMYRKVAFGDWDSRLWGTKQVAKEDLRRVAAKLMARKNISPSIKRKLQPYAKGGHDKIVVTISWDTDNTDIDLHIKEPDGTHVYYGNRAPAGSHKGRLSQDQTGGFGPEQYRIAEPYRGNYQLYVRYYSSNPNAIKDGTFIRLDIKKVIQGQQLHSSQLVFLGTNNAMRLVETIHFNDPQAPKAPPVLKMVSVKPNSSCSKKIPWRPTKYWRV